MVDETKLAKKLLNDDHIEQALQKVVLDIYMDHFLKPLNKSRKHQIIWQLKEAVSKIEYEYGCPIELEIDDNSIKAKALGKIITFSLENM